MSAALSRSRYVLAACLMAMPSTLFTRQTATVSAITAADLRSRLFRIADDSMMGRETGSRGASLTAEYVAAEFKRLGLQPKGEEGGWFQTVPFWVATRPAAPIKIVGGATLRFGSDYVLQGPAGSPTTGPVQVIYGGAANDEQSWITVEQAAGKLVILDLRPVANAKREFMVQSNQVLRSPRFAGAAGVAISELDLVPVATLATAMRYVPRLDSARTVAGASPMWISPQAADQLLGASTATLRAGALGRSVEGALTLRWAPVAYPARNVIGVLPGRDPALRGQYISLTAHNDHVGICSAPVDHDSMRAFLHVLRPMGADTRTWNETPAATLRIKEMTDSMRRLRPVRADSICNGADDDGTGTAAILELAEAFSGLPMAQRPKRSLLFVSHTGEERGLSGSKWYTDHATVPLDSIVAEIDEDMIGRGTPWDLPKGGVGYLEVIGARRLSKEFGDHLEAANAAMAVPFVFNYEFDVPGHPLQYYCRADHYSYARYGIPAVAFSRGEHLDYHQVTDEPQYINYPDMQRVVAMVYGAATRIGNAATRPKLDAPKGDPKARCVQ